MMSRAPLGLDVKPSPSSRKLPREGPRAMRLLVQVGKRNRRRCTGAPSRCRAIVNATARQTGAFKVTILKLLAELGTAVPDYLQRTLVNLPC